MPSHFRPLPCSFSRTSTHSQKKDRDEDDPEGRRPGGRTPTAAFRGAGWHAMMTAALENAIATVRRYMDGVIGIELLHAALRSLLASGNGGLSFEARDVIERLLRELAEARETLVGDEQMLRGLEV